ncbi:TetR family transcriptional regulator [Sulfuricaulis limicola]|uniref:TetR family transcriptional regulator n=1 Tax=Sulfuricaulis limicola TaxID=1620215 RepID=A0A1B4XHG1_9GAMM|nr:TetR/AcrR family transcriptional regulator [Sulfuricaulis limicola]BAV34250.1 TetR family transcriptional regulator [Sulfuricaulis limicola]
MTSTTTSAATRAGSDTIARILVAAEAQFADHGFDAASMSAIAERAGVSKANVFHHFSSKHALYQAVLRHAIREVTRQLQQMGSHSGAVAIDLAQFARGHLSSILEHDRFARLMLHEILSDMPPERLKIAQQVFGEAFSGLVTILRRGQEHGELRADMDPAMVAMLLVGADVFFFQANKVFRHFPEVSFADDPGRYSGMAVDILLRGILAPGADGATTRAGKSNAPSPAQHHKE